MTNIHDLLKTETIHELLTKPLCFLHQNQTLEQVISEINKEHYLSDFKFNVSLYFLDSPKGERYDGAFYLEFGYNNPHPMPTWISNDDSLRIIYLVQPKTYIMKLVPDEGEVKIFSCESLENLIEKIPSPKPSHLAIFTEQLFDYFGEDTINDGEIGSENSNWVWRSADELTKIEYQDQVEEFSVFFAYLSTNEAEYEGSGHTLKKAMQEATESLLTNQYNIPVDDFKKPITPPAPEDDPRGFRPSCYLLCQELLKFFNEETIKRGMFDCLPAIKTWTSEKETVIVEYDTNQPDKWLVVLKLNDNKYAFEAALLSTAIQQALEKLLDDQFNLSLASF